MVFVSMDHIYKNLFVKLRRKKLIMKNILRIFTLAMMLTVAFVITGCGSEDDTSNNDEKIKTIKIGHAPYDYEEPPLEVTKIIAEEQGYEVEVVEGDVGFMFLALQEGDIDIWPGLWLPSIHKSYQEDFEDEYIQGSAIFEDAPTGLVAPQYVDIDNVEDLVGNEDLVGSKIVGFEPGSGMMIAAEDLIEGYDLDMELISGTVASMMAEVDYAISHEEPILFIGWRPHAMFQKYDLKNIDDPRGYYEYDSYYWAVNKDFEEKAPDMYNYVMNFEQSIDDNEAFLMAVENDEKDMHEMAQEWIEENRSDINKWLGE